MAINLRLTPQKPTFQTQNPVENMMKNPVEDFLAPFKQTKSEMEQKLAELSSGQSPKSVSQNINETNWSQFQGNDPSKPNYQPQSLIDYFRTGKTTSELMADGTIPSTQIPASENPFRTPEKSSNPYEGAPQFIQDFGNFYFGTNPEDPTTSGLYETLAPHEDTISNIGQAVKETSENLQNIGADITETSTEVGNWIQNKAPGYEQAKAEGRLLSMDQVKAFLDENPDMTEDQLVSAMADLEKEGYMFEGYNDLNDQEAGTSMTRNLLGATVKGVGSMFGMGSEALGGTMEGVGNIAEGETGLGVSQIAGQVPNVAMTGLNVAFPGAGAAASSLFSTDTGQDVMTPVMDTSQKIAEAGLSLTDLDPNSEEYQNYLKGATGTIPLVAGAAIAKGVKTYSPEIKAGMNKAGEFVKEKAPIVAENIAKAGEKVGEMAGKVGDKISEKTQRITQVATDFIDKELIGIDKSKKSGYQSNPFTKEYFERMVEQSKSAEGIADIKTLATDFVSEVVDKLQPIIKMKEKALSEDSPIYKQIREMPTLVDSKPIIDGFTEIMKKNGLALDENGQVYRAPGTAGKTLNQADVAKINQLYQDILADANANGGKLTTAQTLDARKSASKLAKYDASTTTDGQGVVRAMRSAIDKTAKDSIEGLREIDKNFVDKLESFQDATRDLVYKQGENKGEFISNFNSKIKNLMNDRNSPLRGRLDEIMPDISARIEAINQIPELYKAFNRKLLQSRFADGAVGGAAAGFLAGMSTGPLGAIAGLVMGGIVGLIVEGGLTKFKEARLRAIVSKTSSAGKARLDAINKKFAKNEALSKSDEQFLKDLQKKIALALVKEKMFPKEGMKLLAGPSGLDLSADVVNVKPITARPSQARQRLLGNTRRNAMKVVSPELSRPTGTPKTKPAEMYGKEAIELKQKTAAYERMVKNLKEEIASNTKAARYGGTGNERVESSIRGALDSGKIDQATAFDIITEIIDDSKKAKTDKTYREKYSYINEKKLEDFLNDLYTVERKPQSFDDFVAEGAKKSSDIETKPVEEKTPYQMFNEINRAAHDRRFSNDTIDTKIAEFKKATGKDPLDVSYSDFDTSGQIRGAQIVTEGPKTFDTMGKQNKRLLPNSVTAFEKGARKIDIDSIVTETKYNKNQLENLISHAKETGEIPTREMVIQGFSELPRLMNRSLFIDKITEFIKRESGASDKPKKAESKSKIKESEGDLVALHNLGIDKIMKIKELGGMPGPSIAITKKNINFDDFGDITLVGDKNLIQSMKAKTYSADIYSPRVPSPEIIIKDRKIVSKISKETGIDEWKVDSDIKDGFYTRNDAYKPYLDEISASIQKKLFKGYTNIGNRRYSEYNLDNVLKEMFSEGNKGAESGMFKGNLSQTMGKNAKSLSLSEIKKQKIESSPELDAKYQSLKDEWVDIVGWEGKDLINDYFSPNGKADMILQNIQKYPEGKNFKIEDIIRLQEIVREATELPKSYLETKFTRGVQLNEFKGVIAPEEQVARLKDILKGTGLDDKIVGYSKGESRNTKLDVLQKKFGNIFFNIGGAFIGIKALMNMLGIDSDEKKSA